MASVLGRCASRCRDATALCGTVFLSTACGDNLDACGTRRGFRDEVVATATDLKLGLMPRLSNCYLGKFSCEIRLFQIRLFSQQASPLERQRSRVFDWEIPLSESIIIVENIAPAYPVMHKTEIVKVVLSIIRYAYCIF